ncbi:succinyl-diaminopimelate desuccinylase [Corallincola platygyrae]|uniref:Succinyl-diaminopimelate desuccinylase n=1 Tax=Corallincola platygyrae TaxID=1193278 RepID=A0ABW4XJR0_9GAMM
MRLVSSTPAVRKQRQIHWQALPLVAQHLRSLVNRKSITPNDAGCQPWLAERLSAIGFSCHRYVDNGVSNLVAYYDSPLERPLWAFAGHTDVVPPGDLKQWDSNPFCLRFDGEYLIGRGVADMKGGVAAMLSALELHHQVHGELPGPMLFLITSDEEGEAEYGMQSITHFLRQQNWLPEFVLVGEPTADNLSGDTIKVGRRGAVSAKLDVMGRQGHVAYPRFADNAIHKMGLVVSELNRICWDQGSDDFPGTSLQITHIDSGDFTDNMIPARCAIHFNIRYSHLYDRNHLNDLVTAAVSKVCDRFELSWDRPCDPYMTQPKDNGEHCFLNLTEQVISQITGKFPKLSTSGGTSDGRFLSALGAQVIEMGACYRTIHQVNERLSLQDLNQLTAIYSGLLKTLR